MARGVPILLWGSVAAALIGFVIPWAHLDVREPGALKQLRHSKAVQGTAGDLTRGLKRITVTVRRGAEQVTGELPSLGDLPSRVSGIQIPQLANQKNTQVAMALVELLVNERQHVGLKSYAVYLLPGLALVCALLVTMAGRRRRIIGFSVAVLAAAIAGAGFWKLLTTDTRALFVAITIGPGLWLSLWAYVGVAMASGLSGFIDTASPRSL